MADQTASLSRTTGDPLVGRDRELAALRAALTAALAGRGSLVLVGGEAGIGKTALAEVLCQEATGQGVLVLVGRCYDLAETAPYGPWREAFEQAPGDQALPALPTAVLPQGCGGETLVGQEAIVRRVREYLAALTCLQPVLLLLDDLHWADPASLDLLRVLARTLATVPLLVLATYRAEEVDVGHPLFTLLPPLVREAGAARLDLRPLDAAAIGALVAARFSLGAADHDRLVSYLVARSEGNALFLGEVLRTLEGEGLLYLGTPTSAGAQAGGDPFWHLADLTVAPVPTLLRQVIGGRVARLEPEAARLLAVAAVVGQEVPLSIWAVVGGVAEETLLDHAERALEARLLAETSDGGVRFSHALIREVLYTGIPRLRLRALHRQAGEALAARPMPDPDAVAWHFQRSDDHRAVEWLLRAADRAQYAAAWRTAAERVEAALSLLVAQGADAATRGWLHSRLSRLHRHADFRRALGHAEQAVRLAAESGDTVLAAIALEERGNLRPRIGELRGGIDDLVAGVAVRDAFSPDDRDRLATAETAHFGRPLGPRAAHIQLATWLVGPGRFAEVLALMEADDPAEVGFSLGHARAFLGQPAEARRLLAAARAAVAAKGSTPFLIGQIALYESLLVQIPYYADQPGERARVAREGALAWQQASGQVEVDATPALAYLPAQIMDGRWSEAWEVALLTRARGGVNAPIAAGLLGLLAQARGERELAWELVREALPAGPATDPGDVRYQTATLLQRVAAALSLDAGELPAARAWLEAHDRWLAWAEAVLGRAEAAMGWAGYHLAADDVARARESAERALALAAAPRQPLALIAAERLLGQLAVARASHATAQDHLARALALADACAAPYERALCLLALAELHLAREDREALTANLVDARAIFADLGAAPALARTEALFARLVPSPAPTGDAALSFGLTARETEVLAMLAEGLTDRQIGERLFVSRNTVAAHTKAIFGKLGVNTRAAAGRIATRHRLA